MVLADVLEHPRKPDGQPAFIFKGGVVMELRLHRRARATQDVDLILEHPTADIVGELERAIGKAKLRFYLSTQGRTYYHAQWGCAHRGSGDVQRAPQEAPG